MSVLNPEEAVRFFKSHGFIVDEESVKEWVKYSTRKVNTNGESHPINEEDLYRFNDWYVVKGTAYEEGIDDKMKIARLLEEVALLKKEVGNLKNEKLHLENLLGMNNWIWE
jgi:hypothetical protein